MKEVGRRWADFCLLESVIRVESGYLKKGVNSDWGRKGRAQPKGLALRALDRAGRA